RRMTCLPVDWFLGLKRDRSRELDRAMRACGPNRPAHGPARACEYASSAQDDVRERSPAGLGPVRMAGAGAGGVAEELLQVEVSARDVDRAEVAVAAACDSELDRLSRVAERNHGAAAAKAIC